MVKNGVAASLNNLSPEERQATLRDVTYHLARAGESDVLQGLLVDIDFIEVKVAANMLYDLLQDYEYAKKFKDLRAATQMGIVVSLALPSLASRPESLVQALYNQLTWFEDREPRLNASIKQARSKLKIQNYWVSAEAALAQSQNADSFSFPFNITSDIQSVSVLSNTIAIASRQGKIEVRELNTGKVLQGYTVEGSQIIAVALRADGKDLAYKDSERVIRTLEWGNRYLECRNEEDSFLYDSAHGVIAIHRDNTLIAWSPAENKSEILLTEALAPLIVLKFSLDRQKILYVTGLKTQTIGIIKRVGDIWLPQSIPYLGPPIVDADLDIDGRYILIALMDRKLQLLNITNGNLLAHFAWETHETVKLKGRPVKCALGVGQSLGWAFVCTSNGHIACWNWNTDIVEQLADYSQTVRFVQFGTIPESGQLFFSTMTEGKNLSIQAHYRPHDQHLAEVTQCLITASQKIVSTSLHDKTLRWFSARGITTLGQQSYPTPVTALALCGETDDIVIGDRQGDVWKQNLDISYQKGNVAGTMLNEPVISTFYLGADCLYGGKQCVMAAGASGQIVLLDLFSKKYGVIRFATGFLKQQKILPAKNNGLCWSIHSDTKAKGYVDVVSLILDREIEYVVYSAHQIIQTAAVSANGKTICIAGQYVELLHLIDDKLNASFEALPIAKRIQSIRARIQKSLEFWLNKQTNNRNGLATNLFWHIKRLLLPYLMTNSRLEVIFRRDTPVRHIAFAGCDELLVVTLAQSSWLEVWKLAEGLPTVAEIHLPNEATCLSVTAENIVVGLSSGKLMSLKINYEAL